MRGEQRLVRGNDILAGGERLQNQRSGRLIAAEQFSDDIDIVAPGQRGRIARDQFGINAKRGNRFEAAIGDARQFERRTQFAFEHRGVGPQ